MNIFRVCKIENVSCQQQVKFVHERIISSEENLAELCSSLSSYARKTSKFRDATDQMAATLYDFASKETIYKSSKKGMMDLAEDLAIMGDIRDESTIYLEEKVVAPICEYGTHCRNAKQEIRSILGAKEREGSKRRQLGKIRDKTPRNSRQIMKAEMELSKACAEVSHMQKALEEHVELFERKKLTDLKLILINFIKAELVFHAEAVQVLTKAYNQFSCIDIEKDFKDVLKQTPQTVRLETVKKNLIAGKIGSPQPIENILKVKPDKADSTRTSVVNGQINDLSFDESSSESTDSIENLSPESQSQTNPVSRIGQISTDFQIGKD